MRICDRRQHRLRNVLRSIDIRETSPSRKTPGNGTQSGHIHQTCENNGETRQDPSYGRQKRGREEEVAHGGRKEESPNSSFIGQPNPEGTNRTNVPPEDTPGLIIQTTTIILLLQPYPPPSPVTSEIYTFLPVQSFPTVWVLVLAGQFYSMYFR